MPIVLFFSSRQISAHPIRNFWANPSTPGWFDSIAFSVLDLTGFIYLKQKTLSHLSSHVVNRLLRENPKSIPNLFNGKKKKKTF